MEAINNRIGIVGLGYVGLTLGVVLAEVGYTVIGCERRSSIVSLTNSGKPHFSETGLSDSLERVINNGKLKAVENFSETSPCDAYIITVGTPLDKNGHVNLDMIASAATEVADNMPDGALVILRSTVMVGTAREIILPILTASKKKFNLAMCPERTLEGNALQELREVPQIIGADDSLSRERASSIFRKLTNTIVTVSTLETAETIKLIDNTYRDVQFAFANEVARFCESFDINAHEVITLGKLGYKRTNVPLPGPVGGPCLEKDPHILVQSARNRGITLEIAQASRLINERQPSETVNFIFNEAQKRGLNTPPNDITLLGLAFKGIPATDDLRGSMSLKILKLIKEKFPNQEIKIYDPVISTDVLNEQFPEFIVCNTITEAINGASIVIIANNHPQLSLTQPPELLKKMGENGFIYDYWNNFSNSNELAASYFSVGNIKKNNLQ